MRRRLWLCIPQSTLAYFAVSGCFEQMGAAALADSQPRPHFQSKEKKWN
jgi:hypothetical protein